VRNLSHLLTNADDEKVLAALFRIGASEGEIPSVDEETVGSLLRRDLPELRERTLFVFGIRGRRRDLCGQFEQTLLNEPRENWVVIGAAVSALYSSGCFETSNATKQAMLHFLGDDRLRDRIGGLICAFALRAANSIDDEEYTRLTLIMEPPSSELIVRARVALSQIA